MSLLGPSMGRQTGHQSGHQAPVQVLENKEVLKLPAPKGPAMGNQTGQKKKKLKKERALPKGSRIGTRSIHERNPERMQRGHSAR